MGGLTFDTVNGCGQENMSKTTKGVGFPEGQKKSGSSMDLSYVEGSIGPL